MTKFTKILSPTLFAVAIAIVVFLIKFTPNVLDPTHYDWLMSYADCPTEYVSWQFYRNTPWHFPVIGTLVGYDHPTVTGIGLTGAIPLLAIPFKILSPFLPTDFQYFGYWFLLCYVLQAVFSVRLLRGVSAFYNLELSAVQLVLGAVFFILSPALLTRSGHINLCGQWLVLWALCVYFEHKTLREKFVEYLKIIGITALVHQYLLLMIFGLAFATYWKSEKIERFSWLKKIGLSVLGLAVALVLWYFVGNFNTAAGSMSQVGFGKFSSNLNVFFNGQGEQFLMPTLPVNEGQYEGQGYLGIGILSMVLVTFLSFFIKKWTKSNEGTTPNSPFIIRHSPLKIVAFLFTIFAFSHIFTFGNKVLFNADFLLINPPFRFLTEAFRSSGRFIWVAHYTLMAVSIVGFLKLKINKTLLISALSLLTLLQVVDTKLMVTREHKYYDFDGYEPSIMTSKTWQQITSEAQRVVMLPLYTWHYKTYNDYIHFARVAALNHQSITTGYLARPDWDAHEVYEKKLFGALEKGALGDETNSIFIATKHSAQKIKKLVESGQIKAFTYQDYIVGVPVHFEKTLKFLSQLPNCTTATLDTEGLAEFIEHHKKETILAVVKDDGAWKLCEDAKEQFRKMGSGISKFALRSGLAIVINDGKIVYEQITPETEAIIQKFKKDDNLKDFMFKNDIELHSAGGKAGNFGKIIIGGKDYSLDQRGFNLVVLDKDFKVVKTAFFDTFDDCYSGEVK
jgi:Family of unknown function (DUF6311)